MGKSSWNPRVALRRALVILLVAWIGIAAWMTIARKPPVDGQRAGGTTPTTTIAASAQEATVTPDIADPTDAPPETPATSEAIEPPPVLREEHAPLEEIDGWLQSEVTSLEELRGQVVIVEFWTFGCYNCRNRIPYTQDIYAAYRDQGLEIVGIHSPEFAPEREVENITEAIDRLGVTWPVVLDTDRRTFRAWQGSPAYWPRTYVLDRQGRVRFDHIGEGAYQELELTVIALLAEPG